MRERWLGIVQEWSSPWHLDLDQIGIDLELHNVHIRIDGIER